MTGLNCVALSFVYLLSLDTSETVRATAAAAHFVPSGDAEVRAATEEAIVDGFVLIAVFGVTVAGVAATSALFIRQRGGEGKVAATPSPALTASLSATAGQEGG